MGFVGETNYSRYKDWLRYSGTLPFIKRYFPVTCIFRNGTYGPYMAPGPGGRSGDYDSLIELIMGTKFCPCYIYLK